MVQIYVRKNFSGGAELKVEMRGSRDGEKTFKLGEVTRCSKSSGKVN